MCFKISCNVCFYQFQWYCWTFMLIFVFLTCIIWGCNESRNSAQRGPNTQAILGSTFHIDAKITQAARIARCSHIQEILLRNYKMRYFMVWFLIYPPIFFFSIYWWDTFFCYPFLFQSVPYMNMKMNQCPEQKSCSMDNLQFPMNHCAPSLWHHMWK